MLSLSVALRTALHHSGIRVLLCLAVCSTALSAQSTWTGAAGTNWSLSGNWSPVGVPGASDDVVIPATTNQPSSFLMNPVCRDLTVDAGATLTLGGGFDLSVGRDFSLNGTLSVASSSSVIGVVGNWVNNGTFNNGLSGVDLSGTGTLTGSATTTFHDLSVSAGVRTAATAFAVQGDVSIASGATLDLGAFTHTVVGNWLSSAPAAAVTGSGLIDFTGSGQLTTLGNSLPNMRVSAGVRSVNSSVVAGNLFLTGGTLQVQDGAILTVSGDATLSAGTLGWTSSFAGPEVLDVAGDVICTVSAGSTSADARFEVAGNWSSTSAFAPAAGTVSFDGGTAAAIAGASPTFANVEIVSGTKTVSSAALVTQNLDILSGAALVSSASLDINGDVSLGDGTASWALGAVTHTVAGNWSSAGASATGTGVVAFDGPGTTVTGAGTLANVVNTVGVRLLQDSQFGTLTMNGGQLRIQDGATVTVSGDATLSVGVLAFDAGATGNLESLIVGGNVTIAAATAGISSADSAISCTGNWSSGPGFAMTNGFVALDGVATTVGGAGPVFPNLLIQGGTQTLTSPVSVTLDLSVASGSVLSCAAVLDVNGNFTIGDGTAGWDLGTFTHTVGGNYNSAGANAFGAGAVAFDGSGSVSTGGGRLASMLVTAGTRTVQNTIVLGDLSVSAATLDIQDNQSLVVGGSASFTNGSLILSDALGGVELLDVQGDVSFGTTTIAATSNSLITCAGNWSADASFAPTAGRIEFDGSGIETLSGTPIVFDLMIRSGTTNVVAPLTVGGDLTVLDGATLDANAALAVSGDVSLGDGTAGWNLGGSVHTVTGSYTSLGASASGLGKITFNGTGTLSTGGGSIADVEVSAGTRSAADVVIGGGLELSGGTLQLVDDALVTVGGVANLHTGTLAFFGTAIGGNEVLDVAGDVTLSAVAGTMIGKSRIQCAGNWTSTAAWVPLAGTVELDGGTSTTVGGVGANFAFLNIGSGTKTVMAPLIVASDLTVKSGSTLTCNAPFDIAGNVFMGDGTATWNLGSSTHTVEGTYGSVGGSALGAGFIEFDNSGTTSTGSGSISNVRVSGGLRILQSTEITGNLDHIGGSIRIADNSLVHVAGDASIAGLVLAWEAVGDGIDDVLDVDGNVILTAAQGTTSANSVLRIGGNYSGAAAFVPISGRVILDGGTATTVSGVGLAFANLIVASGTKTVSSPAAIAADLTVNDGATLKTDAALDVQGDVFLGDGTASWDMGLSSHTVAGNYTSTGASAFGAGEINFDGLGTTTSGSGSISNVRASASLRVMASTEITGNLEFVGGSLRVADDALVHVAGNANLAGIVLAWDAISDGVDDVLDVDGDVNLTAGTALISAESVLRVGGNYVASANFSPVVGRVIFDSGTVTSISGTGVAFANLIIESGTKTQLSPVSLINNLTVTSGAALISNAAMTVAGAVLLGDGTASWDLGTSTHTVRNNWTSAGAAAFGTGTVDFVAAGQLSTGLGTISNVSISAGSRDVLDSTLTGTLSMTGGQLVLDDDQTLSVAGDVSLLGGTLAFQDTLPGLQLIDIAGSATLTCAAGTMSATSRIECAGNWSSDAAWTPTDGTVSLDGGGVATVSGTGTAFANLEVASGTKTVTGPMSLSANLDVLSGAVLDTNAPATIVGSVTLGDATASWDLGVDTHVVNGAFVSAGASAIGTGGLLLQTNDAALASGVGSIANLTLVSGNRTLNDTNIAGDLTMTGGSLTLADDQTLTVGGDLTLSGGSLAWSASLLGGPEVIDVAGNATITAAAGTTTANSVLRVAGNWMSNGSFAPSAGLIELDGVSTTTITATGPGFDPSFHDLLISNGTRQVANDLTLAVNSLDVAVGAELDQLATTVTIPAGLLTANGTLTVGAGGRLELGPAVSMLVATTGTLNLVGTPSAVATIGGTAGGGYLLSVAGTLAAGNFAFEQMGASGIVIADSATLAAFPNDLRGGTFSEPSAVPGSVMLDVKRVTPTEFRYINFQDPLNAGSFNVRALSGSMVDLVNASGNLAGATFEQDPFGLVDWTVNLTTLSTLKATPSVDQVQIDFVSSAEVDAVSFLVERGLSAAGPFTTLATLPAAGPSAYSFLDTTAVGYTTYTYQVSQVLSHGGTMALGQVVATPWSTTLPPNMASVGPSGGFADIDSALASLAGQFSPMVLIETGSYPAFTVNTGMLGTLRISPDGSGPVTIDTTAGPVVIQNLTVGESVEINDLTIGDVSSPNGGVVVQNCAGLVILDELNVRGGVASSAVAVSASTRVAIQRTAMVGFPGLSVGLGSVALNGGGSVDAVDLSGNSSLRVAGVTPGSTTVEPGSTLTTFNGTHADIDMPDVVPLGSNFVVTMSGTTNGTAYVLFSLFNSWLDLPGSSWAMVGMIDFNFGDIALVLPLGANGQFQVATKLPADGILVGVPVVFQTVVVHPLSGQRRWSNVVSVTGIP